MLEPELLPPKITKLFLEHKHNSVFMILSEILVLTLVCVYVLVVLQRGSIERFLWGCTFTFHELHPLWEKIHWFRQNSWAELNYLLLVGPVDELHLISWCSFSVLDAVTGSLRLVLGPVQQKEIQHEFLKSWDWHTVKYCDIADFNYYVFTHWYEYINKS